MRLWGILTIPGPFFTGVESFVPIPLHHVILAFSNEACSQASAQPFNWASSVSHCLSGHVFAYDVSTFALLEFPGVYDALQIVMSTNFIHLLGHCPVVLLILLVTIVLTLLLNIFQFDNHTYGQHVGDSGREAIHYLAHYVERMTTTSFGQTSQDLEREMT